MNFFDKLFQLNMKIKSFNWGFFNFLFELCIIITAVIWACIYDSALLMPLLSWIFTGLIVLIFLLAVTILGGRFVVNYRDAKLRAKDKKIRYYKNMAKKAQRND